MWQSAEVSLRPEVEEDWPFVEELVFATRENEPGFSGLPLGERTSLLKEQARLQATHYRKQFSSAHFLIIEVGGRRAGRYYLNQAADHFHVIELSILPEYQKHGIGHQLMKSAQAEAIRMNLPVRLRVARGNPARKFYQGLGFKITGTGETHDSLEWVPGNA